MPLAFLLTLSARAEPPAAALTLADLTVHQPPCDARAAAAPRLDVESACVDGACAGSQFADLMAAWGEPERCRAMTGGRESSWICRWDQRGLTAIVARDVALDAPAPDAEVGSIFVKEPDALTPDGIGVGVSFRCVAERYGQLASNVGLRAAGNAFYLDRVQFDGIEAAFQLDGDGRIEQIQLTAPHRSPPDFITADL